LKYKQTIEKWAVIVTAEAFVCSSSSPLFPKISSVLSARCFAQYEMSHLKAEAHPEEDQMEWMRTGYTQELMNNEYKMYASNRVRSAMAPETMVQAVAANCRACRVGVRGWITHDTCITECRKGNEAICIKTLHHFRMPGLISSMHIACFRFLRETKTRLVRF